MHSQTILDSTKFSFYKNDTLSYFKKVFIQNASQYQGKTISTLLDKLEFQPKVISYRYTKKIDSIYKIKFDFLDAYKLDNFFYSKAKGSFYCLEIKISPAIQMDSATQFIRQNGLLNERKKYLKFKEYVKNLSIKSFSFYRVVYDK